MEESEEGGCRERRRSRVEGCERGGEKGLGLKCVIDWHGGHDGEASTTGRQGMGDSCIPTWRKLPTLVLLTAAEGRRPPRTRPSTPPRTFSPGLGLKSGVRESEPLAEGEAACRQKEGRRSVRVHHEDCHMS